MSFFGLTLAGKALSTFQEAANVTADNLGNANTPGASRQVAEITQSPPIDGSPAYPGNFSGTLGDGVSVSSITRIHDNSYDVLFRGATASQSYYTTQQQILSATESGFGEPNAGVNTAYTNFQTSISNLASQPTSTAARTNVISQAQTLASTLNSVATSIQTQESQVVQQGAATVTKANGIIDQIAALNGQIRASKAVGNNPNTYADQRDYLIDQLSQLVPTQTSIQANGSTLVTVNGLALVNDQQAYHLAPPVVQTNADGTQSFVVGFAADPNPSAPAAIPLGSSGTLGALADVYNTRLQPYAQRLDNFANSLANEVNRVTTAGYDQNDGAGHALFVPSVANTPVTAGNIAVGITDPAQLPAGLVTTAAGTLVTSLNAANQAVNTSSLIDGNATLANPPASSATGLTGFLKITVDGIGGPSSATVQQFAYSTQPGGNADSIADFVQSFNAGHYGVTASFDSAGQRIVFARDPNNTDPAHRALQGSLATTPSFTVTDSLQPAPATLAVGQPATSLLEALGAGAISSVTQDASNAYGVGSNANANALTQVFAQNVGVPGFQGTSATAVATAGVPTTVSLGVANPLDFPNFKAGDVVTVDAGTPNAETVTLTGVDKAAGTITAVFAQTHAAGFSVAAAPQQTLGAYYGALVTQVGIDSSTAKTGTTTQTALASSIDKARQGIDGINVDEETQNLLKYQNAYQAAAQTVSVLNSLLDTVINTIGAKL